MKGYTIQHSIELLEKKIKSLGSGGSSTAAQVSFNNTDTGLLATNVQDAISELNKRFIYSSSEKVVGKWLDGRPVYSKTFAIESPATAASALSVVDISALNVDTVIDLKGVVGTIPINWYLDATSHILAWVNGAKSDIVMNVGSTSVSTTGYITLLYLKPTPTKTRKKNKED